MSFSRPYFITVCLFIFIGLGLSSCVKEDTSSPEPTNCKPLSLKGVGDTLINTFTYNAAGKISKIEYYGQVAVRTQSVAYEYPDNQTVIATNYDEFNLPKDLPVKYLIGNNGYAAKRIYNYNAGNSAQYDTTVYNYNSAGFLTVRNQVVKIVSGSSVSYQYSKTNYTIVNNNTVSELTVNWNSVNQSRDSIWVNSEYYTTEKVDVFKLPNLNGIMNLTGKISTNYLKSTSKRIKSGLNTSQSSATYSYEYNSLGNVYKITTQTPTRKIINFVDYQCK